mgnify:CR=1 FL=1
MKSIKEYINDGFMTGKGIFDSLKVTERLLGSEDDLLNSSPKEPALDWIFDEDNANIVHSNYLTTVPLGHDIITQNSWGELSVAQNEHLLIHLYKPLPSFIKFNKNDINNGDIIFGLKYNIKSQKDVPDGAISYVYGDINNIKIKTNPSKVGTKLFMYNCNSIKNFTIDTPKDMIQLIINIPNSNIQLKDLVEIKISGADDGYYHCSAIINASETCPNIKRLFYNICKDYKKEYKEKYIPLQLFGDAQSYLKKMYDNGIRHIIYMRSKALRMSIDSKTNELMIWNYTVDGRKIIEYDSFI